eukprot:COSAG02_NODE_1119_length_14467_cov_20.454691_4_plen_95_part_00
MDRSSLTVRMVGEELAREAGRAAAGPADAEAAAAQKRKEAAASAKQAIAAIREEATAGGGDVMDELNIIVAGLSADIEEIIERGIEAERMVHRS